MGQQLRHDPAVVGGPCRRCGLVYSPKTAYTPCFEEGDTLETWKARQPMEPAEPTGIDAAKQAAVGSIRRLMSIVVLSTPSTSATNRETVAAEVVDDLSALITAQLHTMTESAWQQDDYATVVADRDRLAARVLELEAELARRGSA